MIENERPRILVVDDEPFYLDLLTELLGREYQVTVARSGRQALRRALGQRRPDLILLDVVMPEMDGYAVCRALQSNLLTRQIPVIFLTARGEAEDELRGLELGAVDYIAKPIKAPLLKRRVGTHLALSQQRFALESLVRERTEEVERTKDSLVLTMGAMAEMRDRETGMHLIRTERFVEVLARGLAKTPNYRKCLDEDTIRILHRAAPLHDVGKIGVPDRILQKTTALTEEERREMEKHVLYGKQLLEQVEEILGATPFTRTAKEIAYHHHEWWDGSGYPEGRRGTDIPLAARLMAVADVYDALASQRCYKEAIPHEEVIGSIHAAAGTHFDPDVVAALDTRQGQFREIFETHRDR